MTAPTMRAKLWCVDGADVSCIMPTIPEAIDRAREKLCDNVMACD